MAAGADVAPLSVAALHTREGVLDVKVDVKELGEIPASPVARRVWPSHLPGEDQEPPDWDVACEELLPVERLIAKRLRVHQVQASTAEVPGLECNVDRACRGIDLRLLPLPLSRNRSRLSENEIVDHHARCGVDGVGPRH